MKPMKNIISIMMLAMLTLLLNSCAVEPFDWGASDDDIYQGYGIPENFFYPLIDGNDVASIYGKANDNDNISVIASGCTFEISGLPQDIFLAPFPGGSVDAMSNNISMLRDVIPYTHEEYKYYNPNQPWDSYIKFISFKISFPEHTMTYTVRQGNDTHTVCVTFGQTEGKTEFMPVVNAPYWVYQFTMDITKMTVDGEERPVPEKHSIEYRLYYNRSKDNI